MTRPRRIDRLPQQYFGALLANVLRHAPADGEPLIDLGRGNPETGPPPHVVKALADAARARGVERFTASMLPTNVAAHRLFAKISTRLEWTREHGVDEMVAPLAAA